MKVDLSSLHYGGSSGAGDEHRRHDGHANEPAGVLFGHMLNKAGDMMAGYRFMRGMQGGGFLTGSHKVDGHTVAGQGCPGSVQLDADGSPVQDANGLNLYNGDCSTLPQQMTMNMHMLELMYAPADWLTLILMPQFVDMQMLAEPAVTTEHVLGHPHASHNHATGGIGDTGLYALFNVWDTCRHHPHTGLGFSAPTGDVGIKIRDGAQDLDGSYVHYHMQLGSGT